MKKILIITRDPFINFRQMKDHSGITDDNQFQFVINDLNCQPDFIVVNGKGLRQETLFHVNRCHTILLTGEPYSILDYPRNYCSQFGTVLACQKELKAHQQTNIIHTQAILPWYVGVTTDKNGKALFSLTYQDIQQSHPKKEKLISVITSNKAFSKGHVDRLRFIRKLKDLYGDKIDIYGRGINDFDDKWDILAPYRYHIVIENSTSEYYWTEKIADCFLAETYPIYHGCSNIQQFFPQEALTTIDIRNFEQTVDTINHVIHENLAEKQKEFILQSKQLILDKYNLFNVIAETCKNIETQLQDNKVTLSHCHPDTTLYPASKFLSWHNLYLHTFGRNYHKLTAKFSYPLIL